MTTVGAIAPLGDNWHNGVNNAGNKSFHAYRIGVGVPGYTGFVPVEESVAVPSKSGCAERAPLHRGGKAPGDGGMVVKPSTTSQAAFSLTPEEFARATSPSCLWDPKASRGTGEPPFVKRPPRQSELVFDATTTSRVSFPDGPPVHLQQHSRHERRRGQEVPAGGDPAAKRSPFMQSEYMHKNKQIQGTLNHGRRTAAAGLERANPEIQDVQLRHPTLKTSHQTDFGYGLNAAASIPTDPAQISFKASTADKNLGSTKATCHPPGYSGFIPTSDRNPRATAQGMCSQPRESSKSIELSTLFQFPRDIPGYAGYRPKATINDVRPNRNMQLTTTGRYIASGSGHFQPGALGFSVSNMNSLVPQQSPHARRSSIRQHLFSHEASGGMTSDNGRHEAEVYYHKTRPMEGRSVPIIKQGHWKQVC